MSNSNRISIDKLDKEIQSIFTTFQHGVETAVDKAADKVAKEAVKKLKKSSPKGHRGKYKKGWRADKDGTGVYVHQGGKEYRLTHLLENGHIIRINGDPRGEAKPVEHIKPVEEWTQDEFPKEFERQVEKGV